MTELIGFFLLLLERVDRAFFEAIIDAVDVIDNSIIIKIVAHVYIVMLVIDVLFLIDGFALNLYI